jgi:hypothetical protein
MGVWGTGLYDNDTASDLRDMVRALARLPFTPEEIVEKLRAEFAPADSNPGHFDHATFWIALADQLAKCGIEYEPARAKALRLIDEESHLRAFRAGGASEADLRAHARALAKVRERLVTGQSGQKQRRILKKPQTYVFELGDVVAYPTSRGRAINPYVGPKEWATFAALEKWEPDGWQAIVVVERGREFGIIAWYRCLRAVRSFQHKPTLASLWNESGWVLENPGTFSRTHFKRMQMERVGTLKLDPEKVNNAFASREGAREFALADISIAEWTDAAPGHGPHTSTIRSLKSLVAAE